MFETPGWSSKKDEAVYKVAGSANLQKYGQFFKNLIEKFPRESSDFEYIVEGPIRLVHKIEEDEKLPNLAKNENKIFFKLLVTIGGICKEVSINNFFVNS